jgi:hypothetical protein
MIIVKTESGSTYEVNENARLARRVRGSGPATFRFSVNGEGGWREYERVFVSLGEPMTVVWGVGRGDDGAKAQLIGFSLDPDNDERLRTTVTSRVVSIENQP